MTARCTYCPRPATIDDTCHAHEWQATIDRRRDDDERRARAIRHAVTVLAGATWSGAA